MHASSNSRSRPQRPSYIKFEALVSLCLLLIVGGVFYRSEQLRSRFRILGATSLSAAHVNTNNEDFELVHARLLKDIAKFNAKAVAGGQLEKQILMKHESSGSIQMPGGSQSLPKAMSDTAFSGSAPSLTLSRQDPTCACEKNPADVTWPMKPAAEVAKENPELAEALRKSAKNNEIMLALANGIMMCKNSSICWWNGGNILESFLEIIDHNNITNHLIGVMDDETERYLKERKYNWFRVTIAIPESQKNSHPANRVSTIKYTLLKQIIQVLLKQIIQMGYHTLITDMDLVYLKNPFDHIHRDSDIEIQTDGFDDMSYGVIDSVHDPSMGWGAGGLFMKLFTTNVGCVWVKSNQRTFTLMSQVSDHLQRLAGWDQQVFNQYLLRPSYGNAFKHSGCSLRVMDYMLWTNSKIFFKSQRSAFIPGSTATATEPLMVHFNYHPDKHVRMLCIMDRFFKGNVSACDHLPPGSAPK
ncbi:hypothetical protein CEUSTIGMA_g2674.t1 [Chlamydomonas eustigma]|uniref:Nucleotide-diphospho-sugar transferase domain-containing protein n=1 Tax=Chlamydomonas eustigma TaxID=1157962 RepID=A0A250WX07_9CHLO|nr:hypothetical protein CEUSTIGMA_g2674.t1 [Chlamydomonas eustigma]|eukprot:GAX75229.1 hypothetical protein CEUSTIGMA_g2674.t1 [Chlamydomonas eustigma]